MGALCSAPNKNDGSVTDQQVPTEVRKLLALAARTDFVFSLEADQLV
jgi:hypothetical protein